MQGEKEEDVIKNSSEIAASYHVLMFSVLLSFFFAFLFVYFCDK